jgi:pyrrolidone-carboxylate peptidase
MAKNKINLTIQVVGLGDLPLYQASVGYRESGKEEWQQLETDRQAAGSFHVGLPPGQYEYLATAAGYTDVQEAFQLEGEKEIQSELVVVHMVAKNAIEIRSGLGVTTIAYDATQVGIIADISTVEEVVSMLSSLDESHAHLGKSKSLSVSETKDILKSHTRFQVSAVKEDNKSSSAQKDQVLKIRNAPGVVAAGPIVGYNKLGPILLGHSATIAVDYNLRQEAIDAIFQEMGAVSWNLSWGTGNQYNVEFTKDKGIDFVELLNDLVERGIVLHATPHLMVGKEEEAVPNDFLWPYDTSRNTLLNTGAAWDELTTAGVPTYGSPNVVAAVLDGGVRSVAGVPDNPDFQGTVTGAATTTMTAALAAAPRATITVDSVAGISVGDRLNLGVTGGDRFLQVFAINVGLNQLTIDALLFDHPGREAVIDVTAGVTTRLAAGGVMSTTVNISVASAAGLAVGDSVAVGNQGNATCEQAVITNIAGNVLTVRGLRQAHANATAVQSRRKMYRFFDFTPAAAFGANNDATTSMHGTACAGIVGAKGNNNIGSAGMAPNIRLMGVKMTAGAITGPDLSNLIQWTAGLLRYNQYAAVAFTPNLIQPGADILTCSILIDYTVVADPDRQAAMINITRRGRNSRGSLMFWSAGNGDVPMGATRWSSHQNVLATAASWVAQFPAAGAGTPFTKEERAYYSNYTNGANLISFAAISGASQVQVGSRALPYGFYDAHNPPFKQYVLSTSFAGQGNVPSSSTAFATLTVAAPANANFTMEVAAAAAGAVTLTVNNSAIFAVGDWILIGQWNDPAIPLQWRQVTGIPAPGSLTVNALTFATQGFDLVSRASVVTVNSTAGFVANSWVMIGNPAATGCEVAYVQQIINGTTMRISGPMNAAPVGTRIHRGPLDYQNRFNGTSAAAPNAAGTAALLLSAKPTLTWLEVRDLMQSTALKVDVGTIGFTIPQGALPPQFDGMTGVVGVGAWRRVGLPGSMVMNIAAGIINPVGIGGGSPTVDTLAVAAVQGATTITVSNPGRYAVGIAIQIGAAATFDFSVVRAINGSILTIEPLIQPHAAGAAIVIGGFPTTSDWYGAGRLDPIAATRAARLYSHNDRDLMIRNFVGDDGVAVTNPAVNPIHSPDIFIRNANDIVFGVPAVAPLTWAFPAAGPHQQPTNGIAKPVRSGAGLNDFRVRGFYTGAPATYIVQIDSVGPTDTWRWSPNNGAPGSWSPSIPIVANAPVNLGNGIVVTFKLITGHALNDSWTFAATPVNHFIHARVRNRGANLPSLTGSFVRFYVATTDGTMLGNGQTPFYFPPGWNDSNLIAGSINGSNASSIYLVPNALAANPDNIGDGIPNSTPICNQVTGVSATIAANSDRTFVCPWNNADHPPVNLDLRTFLVAEVLPHDGALSGLSPESNNNVSYRELFVGDIEFLNNLETDVLPTSIELAAPGTNTVVNFAVRAKTHFGALGVEGVELKIRRRDKAAVWVESKFRFSGGAWSFEGGAPAWCTAAAPVLSGTAIAAVGLVGEASFMGTFNADSRDHDRAELIMTIKGVHGVVLYTESMELNLFSEPILGAGAPANGTTPSSEPRPHVFASMAMLTTQTSALQFGPAVGSPADTFRVTSSFINAAEVPAYAAMKGFVFVQQQDATRVNLILKPLEQSGMGFTPVKYFIYRGLKLTDFLLGSGSAAALRTVCVRPLCSAFIESLYAINDDINAALGTAFTLLPKAFGWDPDTQIDPSAYLDDYFYSLNADHQLPIATKGMALGKFVMGAECGFEIVLEDGRATHTLGYARAQNHSVLLGASVGLERAFLRETVLGYMDPAAYYGLHYFGGVLEPGNVTTRRHPLYLQIVSQFATKNRVYLDLRNDNGYSLNYYGNYIGIGPDLNPTAQLRIREANGTETYHPYHNGDQWPLFWMDTPQFNTGKVNVTDLRIRKGDNLTPVMFIEHGQVITNVVKERYIDAATLADAADPIWSKEIGLAYACYDPTGVNVSTVLKLHYCRKFPVGVAGNTSVVLPVNYNDNVFGPINALTRERPISAINQPNKKFTVAGDFRGGIDPGETIFVANSTANNGKYTVVSVNLVSGNTVIEVSQTIPSATVDGVLQFNYTLWNTDKPTRWFAGFRKHFVDAEAQPVNGANPALAMSYMTESGAAVDTNRLVLYVQPYHFLVENTLTRTVNRINMRGGTGLANSFWVEMQDQNPNLKIGATLLKVGASTIPVFEFEQVDPNTGVEREENFMALCITDAEFSQIREAIIAGGFSPYHEQYLELVEVGGLQTDINMVNYYQYDVHIQGWNTAGNAQSVSSLTGAYLAAVRVYTLESDRMIFTSEDYSNLENLSGGIENYEEEQRDDPTALAILAGDPTMNTLVGNFQSSLAAIVDDRTALRNLIQNDGRQFWQQAIAFNAAAPYDDRPVYWARLHATAAIKNHPYVKKQRKLEKELINSMEDWSRGRMTVDFTATNPAFTGVPGLATAKKILVTGFDPFDLLAHPDTYNPAGLVALALHNHVITDGLGNTGLVQAAVFPVRYRDFDANVVESFVEKYLKNGSPDQVEMLMTISLYQAGHHFFLERYAARYRKNSSDNRNDFLGGIHVGKGGSWKEFFETTLPVPQIVQLTPGYPTQEVFYNQRFEAVGNTQGFPIEDRGTINFPALNSNANIGPVPSGKSKNGSGGSYLSNEIFYRVSRLREALASTTQTGHLHIPDKTYALPVKTDAQIIQVVRNAIQRSLTAL